jgi:predicted permease
VKAYRLLQTLFPRSFRDRFGRDMEEVFADRLKSAERQGPRATTRLWLRTIVDITTAAVLERRIARRHRQHERERTRPMLLWTDVRQAWRLMTRRRGFSTAIILTLGLGIGATTSVFTVVNALLLRALPYAGADRLMRLYEIQDQEGFSGNVAAGNLDDWCGIPSFDACGAYTNADLNLAGGAAPERVRGASVTPGLFSVLGAPPSQGRLFTREDVKTRAAVVVLAEASARRLFGHDDPVGKSLLLDGISATIVGTLPQIPAFEDVVVWRPLATTNQPRSNHANRGVARLAPNATAAVAQQQLDVVSQQLQQALPDTNAHWWARIEPLQSALTEDLVPILGVLGGLVAALLVLCATSVAALMVGRSAERAHELSVRMALGAGRRRLLTQLFVESAALAVTGAVLGAILTHWTVNAVLAVLPPRLALWRTPGVDLPTLAFAVAVAVITAIGFGVLPAIGVVRRTTAATHLRSHGTTTGRARTRTVLSIVQTSLATLLLVVATLFGTVLFRVLTTDPGFDTDHVIAFTITPPRASYVDAPALGSFFQAVTERLRQMPQVEAVGSVMNVPLSGSGVIRGVIRPDEPMPGPGQARLTLFQVASPGFLPTLGIRLLDGRDFTSADTETSPPVAIVNQKLASMLWPNARGVGQQILVHTDEKMPRLVVGVTADAKQGRYENAVQPEYIAPLTQSPRRSLSFVVRERAPLSRETIQAQLATVDSNIPIYDLATLDTLIERSTSARRAVTRLAIFFGLTALLLAAIGLYGLVGSAVASRRREIGVRVALGAQPGRVMRFVLRRGVTSAAVGVAAGLAAAVPATTLLKGLMTQQPPSQLLVFAIVVPVLVAATLLACWLPARAALSVDPVQTLRAD